MQKRSGSIIGGLILILVGALLLALQAVPGLAALIDLARFWPLIIVGIGALFLLGALLGSPPLAIPGAIIAGIGGLLFYQNLTGNWASWAYAWALIPGFVGVGIIIAAWLGDGDTNVRDGGRLIVISLILFVVFGAITGGFGLLGQFWPLLLIGLGLYLLWRSRR